MYKTRLFLIRVNFPNKNEYSKMNSGVLKNMSSVGNAMNEIQDFAVMTISISVIYFVGGAILEQVLATNLLPNTSAFYGTVASIESIWNSSLGMMVAAVVIILAGIILRQLRGGFGK